MKTAYSEPVSKGPDFDPTGQRAANVNAAMCKSCIFRTNQDVITPERLKEIMQYVSAGTNHECHTTRRVCREARDLQLSVFRAQGFITEATDEALNAANQQYLNYRKV